MNQPHKHSATADGARSEDDPKAVPRVYPFALYGAWRAQVVMGTQPGSQGAVRDAIQRLYSDFGMAMPWIVFCDGPFQICALATIIPRVLVSPEWFAVVKCTRGQELTDELWQDIWAPLFSELIEPMVLEIDSGIYEDHRSPRAIQLLNRRIRTELRRRLLAELNSGLLLSARLPSDTEAFWRGLSINMAQQVNSRFGRRTQLGLPWRPGDQPEDELILSSQLSAQQSAWLEAVMRHAMRSFSHATNDPRMLTMIRPAWLLPVLERVAARAPVNFPEESLKAMNAWCQLAKHASAVLCSDYICFVADKPDEIHIDDQRRPHRENGPCIRFRDGFEAYAIHGVPVEKLAVKDPAAITPAMISGESNIESRRVLTERYGIERFLTEGNAILIHQDDFGQLFMQTTEPGRIRWAGEPLMWLRVRNSTAEPDGTHRHYILRVPPHMASARQAVAWTFGMTEKEYEPELQT